MHEFPKCFCESREKLIHFNSKSNFLLIPDNVIEMSFHLLEEKSYSLEKHIVPRTVYLLYIFFWQFSGIGLKGKPSCAKAETCKLPAHTYGNMVEIICGSDRRGVGIVVIKTPTQHLPYKLRKSRKTLVNLTSPGFLNAWPPECKFRILPWSQLHQLEPVNGGTSQVM